ncbi:MAG: CPBP family intramembrane metalloprotease, partial [Bacteroidales bacterium]|nr:CPBP family intramembrane metalloprotease [Bacteroidales bacterium]
AWGILGQFIFMPEQMAAVFGKLTGQHPLFFLAVYAPAISAFAIILHKTGVRGLKGFLSRLLIWRSSLSWYAFIFLGIPLIFITGSLIRGNLFDDPFPFPSVSALLLASVFAMIKGPVEEFGWRGMALPLLQRKFAPIWAGLILGVIWGIWHMPAFLLNGTQQSEWSFAPFFIGCVALSVIVTPLFNRSNGSILLTAFFHFMLMNPIFPDAQPYDTYIIIVIAVIVVWINRKTMLTKKGAVTTIIPLK